MGRPLGSGAQELPQCPREGHATGRVTLNGRYGAAPRRQRYRCYPPDGTAPHNFAGHVGHQVAENGEACAYCEQHLTKGLAVAHRYAYPVQDVAQALVQVGQGMSYADAAKRSRARSRRGDGVSGQLVANWVEVFAPVVAFEHRRDDWPETIVCDSTWYKANVPGGGQARVFAVLAIVGYDAGATVPHVAALRAVTRENASSWSQEFAHRASGPRMVISDDSTSINAAVAASFPAAAHRMCRWHLYQNLDALLDKYGLTHKDTHPVMVARQSALHGLAQWKKFAAAVKKHGGVELEAWVVNHDVPLRAEFAQADLPHHYSTSPVDAVLRDVRQDIGARAFLVPG